LSVFFLFRKRVLFFINSNEEVLCPIGKRRDMDLSFKGFFSLSAESMRKLFLFARIKLLLTRVFSIKKNGDISLRILGYI
jgi:hypothetical protein